MADQNVVNAATYFTDLIDLIGEHRDLAFHTAGKTYYVSKAGDNTTGLDWEHAFTTLAAAIALVNIQGGLKPYAMNRLFVDGGNYAESLTVFPSRCDMIGVGAAPSRISVSTVLTTAPVLCHIYNMQFRTTTNAPVLQFPAGSQGIWLIGCLFNSTGGITPTVGVEFGDVCYTVRVKNCKFYGGSHVCMTKGIDFLTNHCVDIEISNNFISAITTGINFGTPMINLYSILIKDNVICRSDASKIQLTNGIVFEDSVENCAMVINNFISAATPLTGHNTESCINNQVNIAGDGYIIAELAT